MANPSVLSFTIILAILGLFHLPILSLSLPFLTFDWRVIKFIDYLGINGHISKLRLDMSPLLGLWTSPWFVIVSQGFVTFGVKKGLIRCNLWASWVAQLIKPLPWA